MKFDTSGKNREMQERIKQYRRTIGYLNSVLLSSDIRKQNKFNIYEIFLRGSLTLVGETWRISEQNRRKFVPIGMDVYQKSLHILKRDIIRNLNVRQRMRIDYLIMTVTEQKS